MREYSIVFKEGLARGLRPSINNSRNEEFLYVANGCIPEDGVLQSLPILYNSFSLPEATSFPFPQVMVLRKFVLVFTQTNIYSLDALSVQLLFTGTFGGSTWSVADFGEYILCCNGRILVYRDPVTGLFLEYSDCEIPPGICILNLNGQLIVGAPGEVVSSGFTGE